MEQYKLGSVEDIAFHPVTPFGYKMPAVMLVGFIACGLGLIALTYMTIEMNKR
jgi:hypothetical protein